MRINFSLENSDYETGGYVGGIIHRVAWKYDKFCSDMFG